MLTTALAFVAILAALLYYPVSNIITNGHIFSDYPLVRKDCELLPGDYCEDAAMLNGRILWACASESKWQWFPPSGIFTAFGKSEDGFYLDDETRSKLELVNSPYESLHLHGVTVLENLVAAVNHQEEGSVVDIWEFKDGKLYYQRTVKDALMNTPNSVAFIDKETLIITNDHHFRQGPLRLAEELLQLPLGSILRCKSSGGCEVLDRLKYPNGVAFKDQKLYVVSSTEPSVRIYEYGTKLHLKYKVELDFTADNISAEGDQVYVAGHPKLLPLLKKISPLKNYIWAKEAAYSVVAKLSEDKERWFLGHPYKQENVYADDGKVSSGSTVALEKDGYLYIGHLLQKGVLKCKM